MVNDDLVIKTYLIEPAGFPERALCVWSEAFCDGADIEPPPEEISEEWFNETFPNPYEAARSTFFGDTYDKSWDGWVRLNAYGNLDLLDFYDIKNEIYAVLDKLVPFANQHRELIGEAGEFLNKRDADDLAGIRPLEVTWDEYNEAENVLFPLIPVDGVLEKFGCTSGFAVGEPADTVDGRNVYWTYGEKDGRFYYLGLYPAIEPDFNRKRKTAKKKPVAAKNAKKTVRGKISAIGKARTAKTKNARLRK